GTSGKCRADGASPRPFLEFGFSRSTGLGCKEHCGKVAAGENSEHSAENGAGVEPAGDWIAVARGGDAPGCDAADDGAEAERRDHRGAGERDAVESLVRGPHGNLAEREA